MHGQVGTKSYTPNHSIPVTLKDDILTLNAYIKAQLVVFEPILEFGTSETEILGQLSTLVNISNYF